MSMSTLSRVKLREDSLDFDEMVAELIRRQSTKNDYLADTRRVGFHSGVDEGVASSNVTIDGVEADFPEPDGWLVNEHMHGQLAHRLRVPKPYYDRMRTTAPELLDTNVRHWFIHEPERRLIRTLDGQARAFLSDRYRRLDDYDLMESILPIFQGMPDLRFQAAALTPTHMYVRVVLPSLEGEVKKGDIVQAGVEIRNSEVGSGSLAVAPFVWRLICLNGMVANDRTMRKYHVGKRVNDDDANLDLYSEQTLSLDDQAFFAKVGDLVQAALSDVVFTEILDGLKEIATGEKVVAPVAATEQLAETFNLRDAERDSVLRFLVDGGDLSQWGMVNAVTAAAKEADSFDRLVELEELGGALAVLPRKEWGVLAAAAA